MSDQDQNLARHLQGKIMKITIILAAAVIVAMSLASGAFAQTVSTTTPVASKSIAQSLNDVLLGSGRVGLGAVGILGSHNKGNVSSGLSFDKTDAVLTLDALRYMTPIFRLKGETSIGVYLSTTDINFKNGSFGPQINYAYGKTFVGLAYVPTHGENKCQLIIGHRL